MKRTLLFLMALLLIVGNAWGQLTLESSTTDPSAGMPEHLYYMKNGNGIYVGTESKYMSNTPAIFALYQIEEGKYKIYDYTSKKWLTYTPQSSYDEGIKDFVKTCNEKENAEYFYIDKFSTNNYQILPRKSSGERSSVYLNYFQGTANNANDGRGLGYWRQNGSEDAGSKWNFYSKPYII